ncbi:MAG: amylo-alpha,6-glucosidase [Glaciihabitans sp.]|nr:amylo-alpha,6-glucosidase [Glaciihabitans sp.]
MTANVRKQHLQPLLSDETVALRAPSQAWSAASGAMGERPIHGLYVSDVRVVSELEVTFDGMQGERVSTSSDSPDSVDFVSVLRFLDDTDADPKVRAIQRRRVVANGMEERLTIASTRALPIQTTVVFRLASDLAQMDAVKSGSRGEAAPISIDGQSAAWGEGAITVRLDAPRARLATDGSNTLELAWDVTIPARGETTVSWSIAAADAAAVVAAASGAAPWSLPGADSGDDRLDRWLSRALGDLDALRLTTASDPANQFLAAGAPWFFTLFGRDSLWAARFLLPLGHRIAADTLRVLAGMQGTESVAASAEQPGKIMHELRRATLEMPGEGLSLPPLYFGTVDATALWICLLADAWKAGMPEDEVEALLPALVGALEWMRDYGDADGDGLLEYVDLTGHGLANQGWKDSGDSVQWRDGTLATGPIALCEVQAYAFEAATAGAAILEHFGRDGADWLAWAAALKLRFHQSFWIDDLAGAYPAIALDASKRPVDTVTSNIGHLLGTGLLDQEQSALVARRLVSPEMSSGYGLRTMSTDSTGYWPLSYHGGSVWTHDTAIAIRGLVLAGFDSEAAVLTEGLLSAASAFDYRMPELHSGDSSTAFARPVPYPAACRPQAWSAAAAVQVMASRSAR